MFLKMFTSYTTASSKTDNMRATVYSNQYNEICTKLTLFSGVFKPAGKVKERRLHFAMREKKNIQL